MQIPTVHHAGLADQVGHCVRRKAACSIAPNHHFMQLMEAVAREIEGIELVLRDDQLKDHVVLVFSQKIRDPEVTFGSWLRATNDRLKEHSNIAGDLIQRLYITDNPKHALAVPSAASNGTTSRGDDF